jgi:hypothetical protein
VFLPPCLLALGPINLPVFAGQETVSRSENWPGHISNDISPFRFDINMCSLYRQREAV